ncbi:hypothetical protein [Taibaiella soli]|uniref:Outer membrane protein beta-barrel domain-containing protein n=1 Tax=Taibaiella soli TaxID=1649169 RepID=A0A2W2BAT9_9BACT|nr:hypothetical protein [Taibaiella soli]PZF70746.1 hypothetical protein DN068_21755 [Taibaiella soli]
MKSALCVLLSAFMATLYPLHASASLAGHGGHGGGHGGHGCHASGHSSGHSSGGHASGHSSGHFSGHGVHSSGGTGYAPTTNPWQAFKEERRLEAPLKGVPEINGSIGTPTPIIVPDMSLRMTSPVLFGTFRYHFSKAWAIDLTAGTQTYWGKDTCFCSTPNENGQVFDYKVTAYSLQTGVTWIAYSLRKWQIYTSLLFGATYFTEADDYADGTRSWIDGYRFSVQYTLVGLRYGRDLGVFGEWGVGTKGLFNGGLSWQMQPHKHIHGV